MYHYDSRQIQPGDTFICLPGGPDGMGGYHYIDDAKKRGATEVLKMTRTEMAAFANEVYGNPSQSLKVVGVTGTNGKTTVCSLIGQCLIDAGYRPKVIGTLSSSLTTPESLDIQRQMADHLADGGTHFVMEVSSHGIDQGRVLDIQFDVKVLTNISQDHLDYHGTFEAYKAVKERFMSDYPGVAVYPKSFGETEIPPTPLYGEFNESNAKAAYLGLTHLGLDADQLRASFRTLSPPPGRFEAIDEGQKTLVIVDYAHTPDGLENVLNTCRTMADARNGRVITVFGCGGDRDRGKRPKMTKAATDHSDLVVLTHDNPRTESQDQIMADMMAGMDRSVSHHVEEDRSKAIEYALRHAQDEDVVMIAGKGHETVQIVGDQQIHFDDREEARRVLKAL